ncbi:MAG: DUF2933 domain-containing protein [Oscillatoria sp. PMC 1051.18]|nr:DUF2933 domain-containing protein [Oscillatoria sp. PMC 1050.18]MEC5030537.1 DUF2933 domain-containing protein [Oscillatoria sp. PMC 1051.18]
MAHKHHRSSSGDGWLSPAKIALYVFLGIAAFFLFTEHLAHLVPVLPWLFTYRALVVHLNTVGKIFNCSNETDFFGEKKLCELPMM